ncbi:hypothetical protein [Planococcus sp. ISL-110]|uniref:hypothetical protein n=1 Tax=Planococcus sp. ISL-110 TaxID=2819167 RepID=UPI001BE55356|nr:hypothetical protein [Planococcus sp. ISL-110]MBT2572333.1 hypothetical protein [Planococcus sp. ISL-110]
MSSLKTSTTNSLFTAKDIAEPLASVTNEESSQLKKYFYEDNFDVVGFHEDGKITGFLDKNGELFTEDISDKVMRFEIQNLITSNTDLNDCLLMLEKHQHLFIIDKSHVNGIVTRSDRQKPAVRMMFFGVITIFESKLASLIDLRYPSNSWETLIGESRFINAQFEYKKMVEKNLEVNLINFTQICDKTDIVVNDPILLESLTGLSKKQAKKAFKQVQNLRDDLAHAQSLQKWFEDKDILTLLDQLSIITDNIEKQFK